MGPESIPKLLIPSYYYFLLLSASGIFSHEEQRIQETLQAILLFNRTAWRVMPPKW